MKKQLLLLMMILLPIVANANPVKIGSIWYNLFSDVKTAEVTKMPSGRYSGAIEIPEKVDYEGSEYSVTNIGDGAFSDCSELTSVTIPNSVTSIGRSAFSGCTFLGSITIPNSVTTIGPGAFRRCFFLFSITIGNSVTSIGQAAFEECTHLTSVTIPNSVTSIGDYAFANCSELTSIAIPNSITSIGNSTFSGCQKLISITIPNSVTSIGDYAFASCNSLTSFLIPNSVTSIGIGAFHSCSSLTSITIPNSVTSIQDKTFQNCSSLSSITIPNSVTTIGGGAFERCISLTSIMIPNSVTTIGGGVFRNCSNLTSITIPNSVPSIEQGSFAGCSSLTSVTISNSVMSIGYGAFYDCSSLTSITIPNSVTSIEKRAFAYCNNLEYVKALPETPPFLYDDSFSNFTIPLKVPKGCKEVYQNAQGWKNFTNISDANKYKLTYEVDNEEYKSYEIEEGTTITPEPAPTKEGYTFSGWSEIPATMPGHDVTVTGTFTINKYKLIYLVDGELYKSFEIEHGATITPEPAPIKEGYTFSGWSWIPNKMPAEDVTVTGSFTINMYKLTYMVDNEVYKSYEIEYGATITPEPAPTKEGYSFTGWSWIPNKMPAEDVIVTGSFSINKYKLTYIVDGEVYKSYNIEYGASITPETEPTKEGFTFSGWSWIPTKMPAEDVSVSGYFNVNQYTITYIIDNEVYMTEKVDYGSTITPPTPPSREGYDFAWGDYPETMPAYDITIYGTYTTGVNVIWTGENSNVKIYSIDGKQLEKPQKGLNIIRMSDGTTKKVVVK